MDEADDGSEAPGEIKKEWLDIWLEKLSPAEARRFATYVSKEGFLPEKPHGTPATAMDVEIFDDKRPDAAPGFDRAMQELDRLCEEG